MSLFRCSKCNAVENTALSGYWTRNYDVGKGEPLVPPLCSECNPAIGKWHGKFPKRTVAESGYVERDGWLYSPEESK